MPSSMLMKDKWFPLPHNTQHSWCHGIETGTANSTTIYPLCMYDEGLGSPSGRDTNPEHASFAEVSYPNIHVDSRVNSVFAVLELSLTKGALETDKITALRIGVMPIFTSFLENLTAKDEKSTMEIEDILELQHEDTDRQCYPLYNGVKMTEKFTGSATLSASVPGLTTTQVLEGVTWDIDSYYDALHYFTNGKKLGKSQGGLKWYTLTRQHPRVKIGIKLRSKSKYANPYMFFGVMTHCPQTDNIHQIPPAGDTTNINHVYADIRWRFNEWNPKFNFEKV